MMRRGKKLVVCGSVCIAVLILVRRTLSLVWNMYTTSLIHLVLLSDSLSKTVDAGQLIIWLS